MQTKLIKLKRELEEYDRKLMFSWHFTNDEILYSQERFKPNSTINPRKKAAVIETFPVCLEERVHVPSKRLNNLIKDGHKSL